MELDTIRALCVIGFGTFLITNVFIMMHLYEINSKLDKIVKQGEKNEKK